MKKSLVILATSNKDEYNKKYFEPIGPAGELLVEYSIYDAIEAGFTKIVFIVTDDIKELIKHRIEKRFKTEVQMHWVGIGPLSAFNFRKRIDYQKFSKNSYALWKAKRFLKGPFLVINARFYCGKNVFRQAVDFFNHYDNDFAILNFPLRQTLSAYGCVDRSVCITEKDSDSLEKIVELKKIRNINGVIGHTTPPSFKLSKQMLATTDIFCLNERFFNAFDDLNKVEKRKVGLPNHKITIPLLINYLVENEMAKVKVLNVDSDWFSIKYHPERTLAIHTIADKIRHNLYSNSRLHLNRTQDKNRQHEYH